MGEGTYRASDTAVRGPTAIVVGIDGTAAVVGAAPGWGTGAGGTALGAPGGGLGGGSAAGPGWCCVVVSTV